MLRKRVDQFGVAEPVIQPAGGNQIFIQLPGLSQSDKERAKEQIQKAAYLEFRMVQGGQRRNHRATGDCRFRRAMNCSSTLSQQPGRHADAVEAVIVKKKPENGLAGDIVKSARWCAATWANRRLNSR